MMKAYITSFGIVSPQGSPINDSWLDEMILYHTSLIRCIEPDFKELIPPIYLRKMPRILKIGLYAAMMCLRNQTSQPDAIITGTGFGCLEELEKFLAQVIESNGKIMFPTSFIHSTNNLVGSQIAMMTKNNNYNMNYVHRSFSFENALTDTMLLLEEKQAINVLTGCIDEITDYHFKVYGYLDFWKASIICNKELYSIDTKGTIAGEGSAFFNISSEYSSENPIINGVHTFYKPDNHEEINQNFELFLNSSEIQKNKIDLLLLGKNGDQQFDSIYDNFATDNFSSNIQIALYKKLCGEYHTSTGFALGVACTILKNRKIPASLVVSGNSKKEIRNILIYNQYRNTEHSFILIGME